MTNHTNTHQTAREIMQAHFGRMWPERHNPHTRASLRDNLRGQREVREWEGTR